ncbi:MAG: hypothetical protein IT210_05560 [Armatimonadetes bacterium]|nr:hypothetical protein [Armatimonadota bacterium]
MFKFLWMILYTTAAGNALAAPAQAEAYWKRLLEAGSRYHYIGHQVTVFMMPEGVRKCRAVLAHERPNRTLTRYPDTGRIVFEDGRRLFQYEPASRMLLMTREAQGMRIGPRQEGILLRHNYRAQAMGRGRVAGRPAVKVWVAPRYAGNASRIFWADAETGLPLRTEYLSPEGRVQALAYFTRIAYPKSLDKKLLALPDSRRLHRRTLPPLTETASVSHLESRAGFDILLPVTLPSGYVFTGGSLTRAGAKPSVTLRFTDGLNSISIFQEPSRGRVIRGLEVFPGRLQQAYRWQSGSLLVTVVGNLSRGQVGLLYRGVNDSLAEGDLVRRLSRTWSVPPDRIGSLRDAGMGFDDIITILALSRESGQDVRRIGRVWLGNAWSRAEALSRYRLDPDRLDYLIRSSIGP